MEMRDDEITIKIENALNDTELDNDPLEEASCSTHALSIKEETRIACKEEGNVGGILNKPTLISNSSPILLINVGVSSATVGGGDIPKNCNVSKSGSKRHCFVYGCDVEERSYGGAAAAGRPVTLFRVPEEFDRKRQWLNLIGREDLLYLKSVFVCNKHFTADDIIVNKARRLLRKNAVPRLQLPAGRALAVDRSTEAYVEVAHKFAQTSVAVASKNTQTKAELLASLPIVKKLKKELHEDKKRSATKRQVRDQFYHLCDKFLSRKFAIIVKAQVEAKMHSSGNRYSPEYRRFCGELYQTSPRAYNKMKQILVLPTRSHIQRMKENQEIYNRPTLMETSDGGQGAREAQADPASSVRTGEVAVDEQQLELHGQPAEPPDRGGCHQLDTHVLQQSAQQYFDYKNF